MNVKHQQKPDLILVSSLVVQIVTGLIFIYSITDNLYISEIRDPALDFKQHLLTLFCSLFAAGLFFYYVSVESIKKNSYWLVGVAFVLGLATQVPLIGYEHNGVNRWIKFGEYVFYVTPAIILFLIIGASRYLAEHYDQNQIGSMHSKKIIFALFGLSVLIINQPDIVTLCILVILLVLLSYSARLFKQAFIIGLFSSVTLAWAILSRPYRLERLLIFLQPFKHQYDSTYQLANNQLMIGGGDLTGQGIGQGLITLTRMKYSTWTTDGGFIYASIVEEAGFLGACCLILCSLVILWRSFEIARKCMNSHCYFEGLVVIGLSSWMALFSLIHIAASTGLIPTISLYYPFVSYDNAYLMTIIFSYGLILRIGMTDCVSPEHEDNQQRDPIFILLVCIFIGLAYHTFQLSVMDDELQHRYQQRLMDLSNNELLRQQQKNLFIDGACSEIKNHEVFCPPQRGKIIDRWGRILAMNTPTYDISMTPSKVNTNHNNWPKLLALLEFDFADWTDKEITQLQEQKRKFRFLKRWVKKETAQTVESLDIPGISIKRVFRRYYPQAHLTADIVGLTDIDNKGISGIEESFNDVLGSAPYRNNRSHSVQLSIDLLLQKKIYQQLKSHVTLRKANLASAIVMNAKTGEIISMVKYPAFNPNERIDHNYDLYNDIWYTFEPAETLMPLSKIASSKPDYSFQEALWKLGFGQATKIELPDESPGKIEGIDKENSSINIQDINKFNIFSTIFQLAKAYSIVANGGYDTSITILKKNKGSINRIFSQNSIDKVKESLETHRSNDQLLGVQSLYLGFSGSSNQPMPSTIHQLYAGITIINETPYTIVLSTIMTSGVGGSIYTYKENSGLLFPVVHNRLLYTYLGSDGLPEDMTSLVENIAEDLETGLNNL